MQYVILTLSAVSLAICVAIMLKLKKGTTGTDVDHAEIVKGATDVLRDEIAREGRTGRETSALQINQLTSSVAGSLKVQQDGIEKSFKQLETQMANLTAGLSQSLDKIREENRRSLLDVRADNERQLEKSDRRWTKNSIPRLPSVSISRSSRCRNVWTPSPKALAKCRP